LKKSLINERKLMDELESRYKLSVADAVALLDVSEATVRRIFNSLEKKSLAIRTYGGIRLAGETPFGYSFEKVKEEQAEEKKLIAGHAANLVKDNSVIYIDSGTTTAQFCLGLLKRLKKKEIGNIIVFTNSIENMNILSGECDINLIGGRYRSHRKDFFGYIAESAVKMLRFNACFLGTDGFSDDFYLMTTDFDTAALNEIVVNNSEEIYILADSSKLSKHSFVKYCGINKPNLTIITDSKIIGQEILPQLKKTANLQIV
jgi:DeoR/GlpR family transcriptional regulator of sugar metabolism